MEIISKAAEAFISLFNAGGATFMGWVTGIIPLVVCLMTFVNSIIKIVGTDKVESFAQKITKYTVLRYSLLPMLAVFFLANPACYTFGRFCKEEHKPAFYDAAVSFVHPITGLFPHANAGELFVWTGISAGVAEAGYATAGLAVRYFLCGLVVILIRGILCEKIYAAMAKKA
ncbi:MAG: PTS glucitol/sorbitol transporter subunit IIC [Eubacteriales bacterium]|nr:PTS glucitol/sorbitol transporter subunit IIC [Eubacteriales bacterium]